MNHFFYKFEYIAIVNKYYNFIFLRRLIYFLIYFHWFFFLMWWLFNADVKKAYCTLVILMWNLCPCAQLKSHTVISMKLWIEKFVCWVAVTYIQNSYTFSWVFLSTSKWWMGQWNLSMCLKKNDEWVRKIYLWDWTFFCFIAGIQL